MLHTIRRLIDFGWLGLGLVWLVAAFMTKQTIRFQSGVSRLIQILLMAAAFMLMFTDKFPIGFLGWRVTPDTAPWVVCGLLLFVTGLLCTLWARFHLGRNWSSTVTVKQNHELIQTGPYRMVRHPIYSGFLLALFGTTLVYGQVRSFVAVLVALLALKLKSRSEEKLMEEEFGQEYREYQRRVKGLVPGLW